MRWISRFLSVFCVLRVLYSTITTVCICEAYIIRRLAIVRYSWRFASSSSTRQANTNALRIAVCICGPIVDRPMVSYCAWAVHVINFDFESWTSWPIRLLQYCSILLCFVNQLQIRRHVHRAIINTYDAAYCTCISPFSIAEYWMTFQCIIRRCSLMHAYFCFIFVRNTAAYLVIFYACSKVPVRQFTTVTGNKRKAF